MGKARVLVVDDSVVVRKLITDALAEDPDIEVVATAAHGRIALAKLELLDVDVVTLDIEMPVMDGLETLVHVREAHPTLPVIMFSTLTERGATATLTALERGASDYVTKPSNVGSIAESREAVRSQLAPRILALAARGRRTPRPGRSVPAPSAAAPDRSTRSTLSTTPPLRTVTRTSPPDVLVIGSSTGGPDALSRVLPLLPGDLPVPVLVTQHMPPVFTRQFAERLDTKCRLSVSEAVAGDRIEAGRVLIAPGDWHLRVGGRPGHPVAVLDQGPQENFCRPAVDVLFRSAAATYGSRVLAVVLTGMGSDGAKGAVEIVGAGGEAVVQDEDSSVVWGMPGAVVAAGAASQVLPLDLIAPTIVSKCARQPARPQSLVTEGAGT